MIINNENRPNWINGDTPVDAQDLNNIVDTVIDGQTRASNAETAAVDSADSALKAQQAAEQMAVTGGTPIFIDNTIQSRVDFTSDPQTQLNQIPNIISSLDDLRDGLDKKVNIVIPRNITGRVMNGSNNQLITFGWLVNGTGVQNTNADAGKTELERLTEQNKYTVLDIWYQPSNGVTVDDKPFIYSIPISYIKYIDNGTQQFRQWMQISNATESIARYKDIYFARGSASNPNLITGIYLGTGSNFWIREIIAR